MRAVFVLALALSAGARASATVAAPPTVALDVVVEDTHGRAVDTLGQADFLVSEQGQPLNIESARFVRATGSASGPLAVPISSAGEATAGVSETRRLIAIFLDEFHVAPGREAERVRAELMRFVAEDLGPGDMLVVLKPLESLLDIALTSDRRAAVQAIASFDPRRGDYAARTAFERNFIAGTPARIEAARAQIAASSLDALVKELGRFSPARKTLIVVSEGFTRTMRRRGDNLLPSVESVVIAANRAHVSVYPIEPSTVRLTEPNAGQASGDVDQARSRDALRSLAEGTAGRTTVVDNITTGLKQALGDASGYYVLTVSRPDTTQDGRFHTVDVRLRRAGLSARARAGYWAASAEDATVRASVGASPILPFAAKFARRSSRLIRPWFGMSRADDGATRVSFVWEPAPRVPGDRSNSPVPAEVGISVTTLDGAPVFEGVVLPSTAGSDPGSGRPARASFETPPGRLLVQMDIKDATLRVVDRDVRDLVVGGFPGPVTLGTTAVLRARTAREYQALALDPEAPPVAARQFSRTERLLIRVPVFADRAAPTVTARLVSSLGGAMRELAVSAVPTRPAEYQVDVPLAALATGTYTVEWTARTSAGEAKDSLPFRVTP